MAGFKELHSYLLRLVIIPVALLCAIVSITYFYLYSEERQNQHAAHQAFLHAMLANAFTLAQDQPERLDRIAQSILAIDAHRAIVLKNQDGEVVASFGKPDLSLLENNPPTKKDKNRRYITFSASIDQSHNGSITIQLETFHEKLSQHQAITGVILATALCFFVLLYFARQFDVALTNPLQNIQSGLNTFLSGEYAKPIKIHRGSVYEELVSLINKLAASHKTNQEHYQENVEQTIQDLKESLETVEIQNIELDIERKNAVQANRAKSEFLSNTSHELKTPLNSIIGFSELMDKTTLTKQQSDYLFSILDAAKSLSTTINDILDYSRLEIGTLTLEHKPVNLREVLSEVVQQLAPAASTHGIRLLQIIDHDVPDNLLGDPLRIKQVLLNLTSNALKFTPEGYVLVSISNEVISDERYTLRFKVTDSGIGMTHEQQSKLFDTHNPAPQSSSKHSSGTGLGLIIAKGLVERMNGHIEVDSSEGKGATFWFTATFALNLAVKNQQEYRGGALSKLRTVIFEKNTMSKMELSHYLNGWGLNIEGCNDSRHLQSICSDFFKQDGLNLIIIDIESLREEMLAGSIRDFILRLSTEYDAFCILTYNMDEYKFFDKENSHQSIFEIDKPISYLKLFQRLCQHYGVFPQKQSFIESSPEEVTLFKQTNIHVLAVDDNLANLKLVRELFKDKGVNCDLAENGKEAIRMFQRKKYHLILMDVQMPEFDGMATTQKIRSLEEKGERIPIVALTAHAANEKKMSLLISGMDDYLSKPVNGDDLQHVLDRWIKFSRETENTSSAADETLIETPDKELNLKSTDNSPVSVKLSLEKSQNKADLAKDMLEMLLDSLDEHEFLVNLYWSENNINALQEVVHKLHGGCCYCGVPELQSICAEIDKNLQAGNTNNLEKDLETLKCKIQALRDWSKEIELEELFGVE